ncbi:cupin domain-containing protein [Sphingomonas sp. MMSM20]|uniref:cupin domain-containing protein n=1 Tax=Sphingomonas lycopersici TaxID=2951807 RepID=UPI0022386D97|nr:cupin domain-containing protein [Sphingomonas lycopersici]MCW6528633.1 cupin domain-containing protein [Sphingomonas lycopersici]
MADLLPVRRVVTGHDGAGRAVLRADQHFSTVPIPGGDAAFALIWTTATVPADNNDETDGRARDAGLTIDRGSVIRIVDMLPGGVSPMHRTSSIDYGIVLAGQVELEVDDGAKTLLGPGDIVVQRGTMHRWRNPSATETSRIAFVLIEAQAYRHLDRELAELRP